MSECVATGVASEAGGVLGGALARLKENARKHTDGLWLGVLTVDVASHILDWNVDGCWRWKDWPDRVEVMPEGTPAEDVGIDLVARRRDDGAWIAVQVKARKLDERGVGERVTSDELDKFLTASANVEVWAERWLVVNGAVRLGGHSPGKVKMSGAAVKVVNVAHDVGLQRAVLAGGVENELCPHCEAGGDAGWLDGDEPPLQTRSCMQDEAVETAVARLRANEMAEEEGTPRGEARGRIVLPCGTGKTRIALRITEGLTFPGELSVVLCPSIALVAQIRREFLQYAGRRLRVMAVCSDKGVAADEERVANNDDLTLDRGMATTEEIKGCPVTTDAGEIADWIRQRREWGAVSVIFGTYQSAQRVSEGIRQAEAADAFKVLVCDEAHRTAGVRRHRRSTAAEERLREFTLCHDRDAFPASYRVYQTATPRIFGDSASTQLAGRADRADFVVRQMDDQSIFGVELYRRSYAEAVRNGWLSDYRIIAMAVGGQEATNIANELVRQADEQAGRDAVAAARAADESGRRATAPSRRTARLPSTGDYLKGMAFALAMGGAARTTSGGGGRVPLRSCIGFLNTIARSKVMTTVLQSEPVREWVAKQAGEPAPSYRLEHLDASSPVARRDEAKRRLAAADDDEPHGVLNVGIFGEGTDSPSLSAVAFLEPRKSPIDVVQAVGRVMRRAEGKALGYIVVPVVIPPGVDAERHLAVSDKHEGWRELGDILQALRAHDKRIEDALSEMLTIQLPPEPQLDVDVKTVVAVGRPDSTRLEYAVVTGSREYAEDIARIAVKEDRPLLDYDNTEPFDAAQWLALQDEPTSLIVHTKRPDGSTVTREDSVVRHKPKANQQQGSVNGRQTKRRASQAANRERGRDLPDPAERARRRAEREVERQAAFEGHVQGVLLDLSDKLGETIRMNLLEKSGLTGNKVQRDLNLLADAVGEAARHLHDEAGLAAALDSHFDLDRLAEPTPGNPRADGATIAALLWMNAAMLHQRVHAGGWLGRRGIDPLADIKSSPEPEEALSNSWDEITRQDFLPVIKPAAEALDAARCTGRLGGLRRALRHLAAEAEMIAETYADMGTDHAGALFNKVMGDQASDGAFFTRPPAADLAGRLALDALDPDNTLDWSDSDVWQQHKTVDLACGSGTLLAAVMAEMKRRATQHGADPDRRAELQKVAVEEMLKGLDVNSVSLQLAATQLMAGNTDVKYRKMGLHLMPYGPQPDGTVPAGSLELFGCENIVAGRLFYDAAESTRIKTGDEHIVMLEDPEMDDAAAAVCDARIVIMNPPFSGPDKLGVKYSDGIREQLKDRVKSLKKVMAADPELVPFASALSIGPTFVALADRCLRQDDGVLVMIKPTVSLANRKGNGERRELARRFAVDTVLTCHQPGNISLSQGDNINQSLLVLRRHQGDRQPTRFIALDRLPSDNDQVAELFSAIKQKGAGLLVDGWGEISEWPTDRVNQGDWTAAIWRSPVLAEASTTFANHPGLQPLAQLGLSCHSTPQTLQDKDKYRISSADAPGAFPILKSKGADGQLRIEAVPDEHWVHEKAELPTILNKAGYLLVTAGQAQNTARLVAVASDTKYVGIGWMPVSGAGVRQAKAAAVFLNSTPGRLLVMRHPSRKLPFPQFRPEVFNSLPMPDLSNQRICSTLSDCWAATRDMVVPQFRDGEFEVRELWDAAVCDALGWDEAEITSLRQLLHAEPHVRGVSYGQYSD